MNTRFNTANISALGPILATLLIGLDTRFGWGMGDVWMTAAASLVIWALTALTPDAGYVYKPGKIEPLSCRPLAIIISVALMAAILSGCSLMPYYPQLKAIANTGIETAVEDRTQFNDKKLATTVAILCDNSIGAVGRYPEGEVKTFLTNHCLGSGASISIDQLMSVLRVIDAARRPSGVPGLDPFDLEPIPQP